MELVETISVVILKLIGSSIFSWLEARSFFLTEVSKLSAFDSYCYGYLDLGVMMARPATACSFACATSGIVLTIPRRCFTSGGVCDGQHQLSNWSSATYSATLLHQAVLE